TMRNQLYQYYSGLTVSFADVVSWTHTHIDLHLFPTRRSSDLGSVYGYNGKDDTIIAGLGDKYLNGYSGNDTYIYTSAGGNDVVDNDSATLVMQGIASTGVTLSRPNGNNDLVLTVTATGKTVTLKNELYQYYGGLTVSFADGVTWNQT